MGGLLVAYHTADTGGHGEISFSNTIGLPTPSAAIAEISLSLFDTASASAGVPVTAFAAFVACTTDGSNPPLPANETFNFFGGSLSGHPRSIVIRSGLKSITYEIDVVNSSADFVVNVFLFPAVGRGNL